MNRKELVIYDRHGNQYKKFLIPKLVTDALIYKWAYLKFHCVKKFDRMADHWDIKDKPVIG